MTSFSGDVKNELSRLPLEKDCCRRAELFGLLRMGGALTLGGKRRVGVSFVTENAAVARRALTLLKEQGVSATSVTVMRFHRLQKNNRYSVRAALSQREEEDFLSLSPFAKKEVTLSSSLLRRECCRAACLRGAFLAGGSVSRPSAGSHFELSTGDGRFARLLLSLLRHFDLPASMTDRKDEYIVYIKEGDAIIDVLSIMNAENAVSKFEVTKNVKEVRNQVNRLVNCETANLAKTAEAAARQAESIKRLMSSGKIAELDENLRRTALARLENPEAPLSELAKILGIGRSGVNHRMRRLMEMAKEE